MEILNKNGMILMDYRREFKRHYADSVDDALKDAILTLYKEGQIPEKLFRIILDDSIDDSVVYTYLLSRREFTKSSMELNSEFNEVREKVNDYLIHINFVKNVCTKNSVNTNRIYIIKQYDIPKELLLSYFGLTPSEIIPLMKRKGFMDKFCVLRLSQAFKEIYSELKVPEHIDHGYSLIYYNKLIQGFSIDYKYMVSINYINDPERLADLMDKIKELDAVVEKKFEAKMSYSYFHQLNKRMNMSELTAEIEKIKIPVRSGKRSQDIRRPELIVDDVDEKIAKDRVAESPKPAFESQPKDTVKPAAPVLIVEEEVLDDIIEVNEKASPATTETKPIQQNQKPNTPKPENKPVVTEVKKEESKKEMPKTEQKPNQNNKNNKPNPQNNQKPGQNKTNKPNPQNNQKPKREDDTKQNNSSKNDQKGKSVEQPTKVDTKPNKPIDTSSHKLDPKPVKPIDDDDDLFGDAIENKPTAKPNKKSDSSDSGDKPILIIDDSDLDMI